MCHQQSYHSLKLLAIFFWLSNNPTMLSPQLLINHKRYEGKLRGKLF
ncbi:hypothetical protein LM500008_210068 [Listeria monocytogenes]|nr:hypothetical protein LM500008_210068 [Listeria monocytogenes]CUK40879.1 hypothetical protein LM500172_170225 [Listeria monocytogenes]CUK55147.1 hypothetical protein LM500704_70063 [Listeria monocytogenes]CUK55768.1 hypothetical protein LM600444_60063 [Listeria monocytogenes]CUK63340.1 hypothetical protein LM600918_200005 [Listeria monocytogenes]